jgi:hypothetical protein
MSLVNEIASLQSIQSNVQNATKVGLNITTIAWEDTARHKNSCLGPNISDLTLSTANTRMPMIRKPNFSDVTGDVPIQHFQVTVGNETEGKPLKRIALRDFLENIDIYTDAKPGSRILHDRDEHILCSAQACILPLAESGEVQFVPQLFNYQTSSEDPAVLVVVATSQGTSVQVITEYAQKLYFNRGGHATQYLAKRLSQDRSERKVSLQGEMSTEEQDRNVLMIYQIPLKQKPKPTPRSMFKRFGAPSSSYSMPTYGTLSVAGGVRPRAGMEHAMLRASEVSEGVFKSLAAFDLVRDDRFPIRVTVQHYSVTDDAVIKEDVFKDLAKKIENIYALAKEKGSLVVDNSQRSTEVNTPGKALGAMREPPTGAKPLFSAFSGEPADFIVVD